MATKRLPCRKLVLSHTERQNSPKDGAPSTPTQVTSVCLPRLFTSAHTSASLQHQPPRSRNPLQQPFREDWNRSKQPESNLRQVTVPLFTFCFSANLFRREPVPPRVTVLVCARPTCCGTGSAKSYKISRNGLIWAS